MYVSHPVGMVIITKTAKKKNTEIAFIFVEGGTDAARRRMIIVFLYDRKRIHLHALMSIIEFGQKQMVPFLYPLPFKTEWS